MIIANKLRESLSTAPRQPQVKGHWRPISMCLDDTACEFLNVGVVFSQGRQVEVRMLDTFDRLECLYDKHIDADQLQHLLLDIEATLIRSQGEIPDQLSDTIRLGQPLFAQGGTAEDIVDEFFLDVVSLARPRTIRETQRFRYRSTSKLRHEMLSLMQERLGIGASRVIQEQPYRLHLKNEQTIDVDVPLLSDTAVGSVASAWYKNPMVVENSILQASADIMLVSGNSQRVPSISVLLPGKDCGLTLKERRQIDTRTDRNLERLERAGVQVLRAHSTPELTDMTINWWLQHGAA